MDTFERMKEMDAALAKASANAAEKAAEKETKRLEKERKQIDKLRDLPDIMGLTLKQPWAHFMADHTKVIENRKWAPPAWMRGRLIALHAGGGYDKPGDVWIRKNFPDLVIPEKKDLQKGAIVAVVRFEYTIRLQSQSGGLFNEAALAVEKKHLEQKDLAWFFGPIGWVFSGFKRLDTPIPYKAGLRKLWYLPGALEREVLQAYEAAP